MILNNLYTPLPDIYKTYLKTNVLEIILHLQTDTSYVRIGNANTHSILRVPKDLILTEAGLKRFADYWHTIDLFRLAPNTQCAVHIDNSYHAFNFVVTNNGYMEWYDLNKLVYHSDNSEGRQMYKVAQEALLTKTHCNMMWVNTKVPHRVVNDSESERWCVSIRTLTAIKFTI